MLIRRLVPSDAEAFLTIRLEALQDSPTAFSSSYEEELGTPISVIAGHLAPDSGRIMFGAFIEGQLLGVVGFGREISLKLKHKGFIRGMYVAPSNRGKGIAKELMKQVLEYASTLPDLLQVTLLVTADNTAAIALYSSFGFKSHGIVPDALLVNDIFYDEVPMVWRAQKS